MVNKKYIEIDGRPACYVEGCLHIFRPGENRSRHVRKQHPTVLPAVSLHDGRKSRHKTTTRIRKNNTQQTTRTESAESKGNSSRKPLQTSNAMGFHPKKLWNDKWNKDGIYPPLTSTLLPTASGRCLAGLHFVFCGVRINTQREEWTRIINDNGGIVQMDINILTDYVVVGRDPTLFIKNRAKQFKARIILENVLLNWIESFSKKNVSTTSSNEGSKEGHLETELLLAHTMLDNGDFQGAISHCNKVINTKLQEYSSFFWLRILSYSHVCDYHNALLDCDIVLNCDPTSVRAFITKGDLLYRMKDLDAAKNNYELALILEPGDATVIRKINEITKLLNVDTETTSSHA